MKVIYAPQALRDIDNILAYIRNRSPRGAHNVSLAIEHAIQMCALNPRAGAKTDEPDVYRWRSANTATRFSIGRVRWATGSRLLASFTVHGSRTSAGFRKTREVCTNRPRHRGG
jgi:plasmid stabilization system protein ParE